MKSKHIFLSSPTNSQYNLAFPQNMIPESFFFPTFLSNIKFKSKRGALTAFYEWYNGSRVGNWQINKKNAGNHSEGPGSAVLAAGSSVVSYGYGQVISSS